MTCPRCGAGEMTEREGSFPSCEECSFTNYDQFTLELIAETKREYEQAKREYWPEPVPPYWDYMNRAKIR